MYQKAILDIVSFDFEDVITTSSVPEDEPYEPEEDVSVGIVETPI